MLKQFVEKQRQRQIEGFYDKHDDSPARIEKRDLDYQLINRQKQILSNTPSYVRNEESQHDGRDEYIKNEINQSSDPKIETNNFEQRDVWNESKNGIKISPFPLFEFTKK